MKVAPLPDDEAQRMAALRGYGVLDSEPEADFDELTRFASELCGTPIALVSLVDAGRQWFKSRVGLDAAETPRDIAFCSHAILQRGVFEVEDASADPRFADNPLVVAAPSIRFYAGAPLLNAEGFPLGTLCVIDRVPRSLDALQRHGLEVLGRQVIAQLELRRKLADLARARDQALAGVRAKDVFLATMGHELRTPLGGILGLSELLLDGPVGGQDGVADDLRAIHRAGSHLLEVVEDILGLAQLELDQPRLRPRRFDLDELLADVEATVRPLLRGRAVALDVGRSPTPVVADPTRVRQIVYNLVANAIRFTERGSVAVTVEREGDTIAVRVRDTGVGIPREKLALLFRDFSQVHGDHEAELRGTGLGLAISRRYARLMGGDIVADSEPGRGSTFTLTLPLEPAT
ncbi:GAF domain-containing sensor histidine kinase [Nannocystis radixulma]|uniref:histidine kinase n=1 Tax=Nannocystis radixulma TaxID=2995305 RepID=A0ABT5BI47_9BACT|nr:GAF domain-containing sensor histidine kinase [Nannocystis radixulma]MDC0673255.1 GAF domain-containing sensor histidine kinase [Nannocystis radixulma]